MYWQLSGWTYYAVHRKLRTLKQCETSGHLATLQGWALFMMAGHLIKSPLRHMPPHALCNAHHFAKRTALLSF
ncbi:MAG: hypothetical protein Q9P01_17225 [Anaerolineae bacterium]|nr:hypothetical protein [Anaerolineae bacterium]